MPVIHLIGPNAIGKTTALRRWAQRYGRLLKPISLDLLRKPGFDASREKQQRVSEWRNSDGVVVESARSTQILPFVSCDGKETDQPGWKGEKDDRKQMLDGLRSKFPLAAVESARTTTTTFAAADDPVIIVTCSPQTMGDNLRRRCELKGKRFRDDYWSLDKLSYESTRRYLTFARKYLQPKQVTHFEVNNYAEWDKVDEFFGQLFRRVYNQLVRSRQ